MTTADTVTYRLVAHDRPRQWHTVSREYFERIKAYVESRDKVSHRAARFSRQPISKTRRPA
jgi:hypothetical protein